MRQHEGKFRFAGSMLLQFPPSSGEVEMPLGFARASWDSALVVATSVLALTASTTGAAAGGSAHYGITITTAATRNVSFSGGVYQPTGEHATLNIGDLENALANGNVEVTTGNGNKGQQFGDLHVEVAALTWASSFGLTLDAYHSIFVDAPVVDAGTGALTLTTNDGGSGGVFRYGSGGYFTIENLSAAVTINGHAYTPVNTVASLAHAIEANPSGNYAIANSIEAGGYKKSLVTTTLNGTVNGLGNTISEITINDSTKLDSAGFFTEVGQTGVVQDLRLSLKITITEPQFAGGLAAINLGQLIDDSVQSTLKTKFAATASLGGLVGSNSGTIARCNASTTINAQSDSALGGLVGSDAGGLIVESFAGGKLTSEATSAVGGLVGTTSLSSITNSYATASVDSSNGDAGGLVGVNGDTQGNNGLIAASYATGKVQVSKHNSTSAGGLVGIDKSSAGSIASSYWDTTTSGITNLSQGAWSPPNDPGITGESSAQLLDGLPAGFDPAIWAQSGSINSGFPYLITNPPPQ
jgi:hypothetical protein